MSASSFPSFPSFPSRSSSSSSSSKLPHRLLQQQFTSDSSDADESHLPAHRPSPSLRPSHRTTSHPPRAPLRKVDEIRSSRPRVLVTGGAGFIGSHVSNALLERGEDIVIVDELNDYYDPKLKLANLRRLIDTYGHARVHVYVADICDAAAMDKCFEVERFDRVIHLAARAGVRPSISDPLLYERSNVQGTITLLEMAKKSQGFVKHFVYASSSSVYGDEAKIPFSEEDPCVTPISPYAATKKSCELVAHTYSHLHKIPSSGLRFFTVYGENGRRDMAPFIFCDKLARGLPIQQFGDGTAQRDFTHVSDIVDGVLKVLDHIPGQFEQSEDNKLHQVYNLGVGSPISLANFISTIASELNVKPNIVVLPKQPGDVDRTFADISKAHRLVGYQPKVSVQEGIRRLVTWYRNTQVDQEASKDNTDDVKTLTTGKIQINVTAPDSRFPPLPNCLCGTRIHNQGSTRIGLSPDVFSHLLIWLPRALSCAQWVAIAVDTTGGRSDIKDAVEKVLESLSDSQRSRVAVVCVSPWVAFSPALNALMAHAQERKCDTILYSSLEIQMHPAHIHTLNQHLLTDTLVVGARLSGHRFVRGQAIIDGCSTVWNTLALWSLSKLSRTGFLAISDGLPAREVRHQDLVTGAETVQHLPAVASGVEEVACVSVQQMLFPASSISKLLSMASAEESWHSGSGISVGKSTAGNSCLSPNTASNVATTSATSGGDDDDDDDDRETVVSNGASANVDSLLSLTRHRSGSCPHAVLARERRPSSCHTHAQHVDDAKKASSIPSLFWDATFAGDAEREAAHEKKMRSKIERAQQQLNELNLKPGVVSHVHVVLPAV